MFGNTLVEVPHHGIGNESCGESPTVDLYLREGSLLSLLLEGSRRRQGPVPAFDSCHCWGGGRVEVMLVAVDIDSPPPRPPRQASQPIRHTFSGTFCLAMTTGGSSSVVRMLVPNPHRGPPLSASACALPSPRHPAKSSLHPGQYGGGPLASDDVAAMLP